VKLHVDLMLGWCSTLGFLFYCQRVVIMLQLYPKSLNNAVVFRPSQKHNSKFLCITLCHILHSVSHRPVVSYFIIVLLGKPPFCNNKKLN
jgi:hypothetical protein